MLDSEKALTATTNNFSQPAHVPACLPACLPALRPIRKCTHSSTAPEIQKKN